jgi:hypothetical protein
MKGFVRAKKQGSHTYYYLVTTERTGRRIRQRVIAYLGKYKSLKEALAGLTDEISYLTAEAANWRKMAEDAYRCVRQLKPDGSVPGYSYFGRHPYGDPAKRYWQRIHRAERCERKIRILSSQLANLQRIVCPGRVVPNAQHITLFALGTTEREKGISNGIFLTQNEHYLFNN